jgi:hypothetical protein
MGKSPLSQGLVPFVPKKKKPALNILVETPPI